MHLALIATAVTGTFVVLLSVLFRVERSRGQRFAHQARAPFDRVLYETRERFVYRYGAFSIRSIRQTIHFVFHQLLTILLRIVKWVEEVLRKVVHFNKRQANTAARNTQPSEHLSAIAAHKRDAELTEEEKAAKRAQALHQ